MRAWLSMLLLFLSGCDMETTPTEWTGPKRVTLVTQLAAAQSDGVHLADGAIVAGGGDLNLYQAMVLSLSSPTPDSLCDKGEFTALSDIPTEVDTCPAAPSGTWGQRAYLSGASLHTSEESYVIGLGLLVWNKEHTELYRLRIAGDSYDAQGVSTATFDYEPVP
jgi:hypothetical protein